jgi:hypothetical protein
MSTWVFVPGLLPMHHAGNALDKCCFLWCVVVIYSTIYYHALFLFIIGIIITRVCVCKNRERVLCEIYDETNRGESLKRRKILWCSCLRYYEQRAVMMVYDHINIFYL